jgi:uncharacterized protein
MSDIFLSRIRVYPIKACAGTDVQEACMEKRGLQYDRRWMLVDTQGRDLHQFDYPRLASVIVSFDTNGLLINAPGMPQLPIPFQVESSASLTVQWYEGICEALPANSEADAWFQDFLHVPCRLVFMPESTQRFVEPEYAIDDDLAAFTSFPYHLLGEASLEDLNQRLANPVPLDRFRPNLVIAGAPAFAEDNWRAIQINRYTFHIVKPCERCAITTVDPVKGIMTGQEPLKTLAKFRTFNQKVLFGQYLVSGETGVLRVGDPIRVLKQKVSADVL